jgi:hypothetical protein
MYFVKYIKKHCRLYRMRLHEGTTLVACEILPVAKTMGLSHAASRILPLRDLSTLPIQQSFGYRVLSKDGFSWEIKPKKVNMGGIMITSIPTLIFQLFSHMVSSHLNGSQCHCYSSLQTIPLVASVGQPRLQHSTLLTNESRNLSILFIQIMR